MPSYGIFRKGRGGEISVNLESLDFLSQFFLRYLRTELSFIRGYNCKRRTKQTLGARTQAQIIQLWEHMSKLTTFKAYRRFVCIYLVLLQPWDGVQCAGQPPRSSKHLDKQRSRNRDLGSLREKGRLQQMGEGRVFTPKSPRFRDHLMHHKRI